MDIEFDPVKNQRNIAERGLSFEEVNNFQWSSSYVWQDRRFDYGEVRFNALGLIGERLHHLTFKPTPTGIRVISLRKANKRERTYYEHQTQP